MFLNLNALTREAMTQKYFLEEKTPFKKDSFIILVQRTYVPCGKGIMSYAPGFFFACVFLELLVKLDTRKDF